MENIQRSTFNIQRSTAEPASESAKRLNVECSTLNVECSHCFLLNTGPGPAALNMALDEALLEAMPRLGKPVLRFYGWSEPAASFGYFQKFTEVERATLLRPLVRRPTGGGIVPHNADWTYSLAFPTNHEWYSLRAEESYRRAHEWIQAAFARLKIPTELASCSNPPRRSRREEAYFSNAESSQSLLTSSPTMVRPGQCFAGYEKSDLLWSGKKIAGAAQRRTRTGLLIQGSVQPPSLSLAKVDWQQAMCDVAARDFGAQWSEFEADTLLRERAEALTLQKYSLPAYNQKR